MILLVINQSTVYLGHVNAMSYLAETMGSAVSRTALGKSIKKPLSMAYKENKNNE